MKTKRVITIILLFLSLASCATTDYSKVRYAQPNDPIYFDRESNFTPRSKVQVRTVTIEPYNAELSTKDTMAYQQKAQELKTKIIPEALADSGFFLPGFYNTDQSSTYYLDMSLHADIWDSGKSRGQAAGVMAFGVFGQLAQDKKQIQGLITIFDEQNNLVAKYTCPYEQHYHHGLVDLIKLYTERVVKESLKMIEQNLR